MTTPTQSMTLAKFIEANGLTMSVSETDRNPHLPDSDRMTHWRCVLKNPQHPRPKRMTVIFSMGSGHDGEMPLIEDVLDCLALDAASIENASDFEDWANELGYEGDSRKAERIYKTCVRQATKLKAFLNTPMDPSDYDTLLFGTERQ